MRQAITKSDLERLSKESARILYGSNYVERPDDQSPEGIVLSSDSHNTRENSGIIFSSVLKRDRTNLQLENALRIIETQSAGNFPFQFRTEAAAKAGVKGAATLLAAEKEALKANIIKRHEIAKAKTKVILWEITDHGYALIKRERPNLKSKGYYKHKFCVHRIANSFSQRGYNATIEYRRPNGKLVDLRLLKESEIIYVEICASFPVEKELINVEKNLDGAPTPTAMYLSVTDRKMKKPLSKALQDFINNFSLPCPVNVILAGDLITPLEEQR